MAQTARRTSLEDFGMSPKQDNPHLCYKCREVFENWRKPGTEFKGTYEGNHHDLIDLEASALVGCPVCELLLEDFIDNYHYALLLPECPRNLGIRLEFDDRTAVNYLTTIFEGYTFDMMEASIGLYHPTSMQALVTITFLHRLSDLVIGSNDTVALDKVASKTDCPETWILVKQWLRNCCQSHHFCSKEIIPRKLPTRLVKVGTDESEPSLCLSNQLGGDVEYLTLSHCWGKIEFRKLLKANFASMLVEIKRSTLCATFQHAIMITRRLGFDYLWIDALCIIQDDPTDWEIEAATMAAVYASSKLNIGAVDAGNGDVDAYFLGVNSNHQLARSAHTKATAPRPGSSGTVYQEDLQRAEWKIASLRRGRGCFRRDALLHGRSSLEMAKQSGNAGLPKLANLFAMALLLEVQPYQPMQLQPLHLGINRKALGATPFLI